MLTRPRVLVVEDERPMRRLLLLALQRHGYDVDEAESGNDALRKLQIRTPEAMILDLGLPDVDGVQVASFVRAEHDLPIIVVSARGDEDRQIRALDAGANDYVTKPFREGELMARLRAALRVRIGGLEAGIKLGDFRLDLLQRCVFLRDRRVELTSTEFRLLQVLATHAGRVVTHQQLLREAWDASKTEELSYLRVYMKQLRRKIEDEPSRPRRIVTALGVGYRLVSVVS